MTTNITRDVRRSEVPANAFKMDVDEEQILQQKQPFQAQTRQQQQQQQQQQIDVKFSEVSLKEFEGKDISHFQQVWSKYRNTVRSR
jgi:hypothetical protein